MQFLVARLCGVVVFIFLAFTFVGMNSPRVFRPGREVAQAIYAVIPQTEESLRISLKKFIEDHVNRNKNYDSPDRVWLELTDWLDTNIPISENSYEWQKLIKDIVENRVDYKQYLENS